MGGTNTESTSTAGERDEGAISDAGDESAGAGDAPAEPASETVPDPTIKTIAEPKHNTDKIARQRGMLPIRRPTGA
jgi:hypothetical protein